MKVWSFIAITAALLATPTAGWTISSFSGRALTVYNREARAVLSGQARVVRNSDVLQADTIVLHYRSGGDTITDLFAWGYVRIRTPNYYGTAPRLHYLASSDTVTLMGGAVVTGQSGRLSGRRITMDRTSGNLTVKGRAAGLLRNSGKRTGSRQSRPQQPDRRSQQSTQESAGPAEVETDPRP